MFGQLHPPRILTFGPARLTHSSLSQVEFGQCAARRRRKLETPEKAEELRGLRRRAERRQEAE
jgi:hypothetical protein